MAILTVWVDDLLLFASCDVLMQQTKSHLQSQWEVTDLGNPTKIIGIEVTQTDDSITISQKAYIESILQCEGLNEMHGSITPMDSHIKLEPNPDGQEGNRSNSQDFSESSNSWQIAHDPT